MDTFSNSEFESILNKTQFIAVKEGDSKKHIVPIDKMPKHIREGVNKKKSEKIQQEIKQGARFEEMARRYSTCPSKSSGGDLGWFGPGKMVKEFEAACSKVGVGTVTGPVRTQFGYHVIKVTGKR